MEHYKVLLSIITRCVKLIKDRHGLYINIDSLPSDDTDDVEVYELIKTDRSNDVFGLESTECNDRMSLIQPTAFHHIIEFHAMEHPFMCAKFSEYIHKKNNPESYRISNTPILKAGCNYKFEKFTIFGECINIMDSKEFKRESISMYQTVSNSFHLRGRKWMIGIRMAL